MHAQSEVKDWLRSELPLMRLHLEVNRLEILKEVERNVESLDSLRIVLIPIPEHDPEESLRLWVAGWVRQDHLLVPVGVPVIFADN